MLSALISDCDSRYHSKRRVFHDRKKKTKERDHAALYLDICMYFYGYPTCSPTIKSVCRSFEACRHILAPRFSHLSHKEGVKKKKKKKKRMKPTRVASQKTLDQTAHTTPSNLRHHQREKKKKTIKKAVGSYKKRQKETRQRS